MSTNKKVATATANTVPAIATAKDKPMPIIVHPEFGEILLVDASNYSDKGIQAAVSTLMKGLDDSTLDNLDLALYEDNIITFGECAFQITVEAREFKDAYGVRRHLNDNTKKGHMIEETLEYLLANVSGYNSPTEQERSEKAALVGSSTGARGFTSTVLIEYLAKEGSKQGKALHARLKSLSNEDRNNTFALLISDKSTDDSAVVAMAKALVEGCKTRYVEDIKVQAQAQQASVASILGGTFE